jgi:hypothetical protein
VSSSRVHGRVILSFVAICEVQLVLRHESGRDTPARMSRLTQHTFASYWQCFAGLHSVVRQLSRPADASTLQAPLEHFTVTSVSAAAIEILLHFQWISMTSRAWNDMLLRSIVFECFKARLSAAGTAESSDCALTYGVLLPPLLPSSAEQPTNQLEWKQDCAASKLATCLQGR